MGPYFFSTLVNLLGPAKQVQGRTLTAFKRRIYGVGPKKGKTFKVEVPTTYLATVQFNNGAIIQITISFDDWTVLYWNDSVFGSSRERNWESPTLDVTTKNITNKKTISIKGVISIEKSDLLFEINFIC